MGIIRMKRRIIEAINKIAIQEYGIHIVANWKGGGSDAVDLPIYTIGELLSEFPETNKKKAKRYFKGKEDGFPIREWTDDHGREVIDTIYFPTNYSEDDLSSIEICCSDDELVIHFEKLSDKETYYRIKSTMRMMSLEELNTFLNQIKFPLSSPDLGTGEAWNLMAFIENIGFEILDERKKE